MLLEECKTVLKEETEDFATILMNLTWGLTEDNPNENALEVMSVLRELKQILIELREQLTLGETSNTASIVEDIKPMKTKLMNLGTCVSPPPQIDAK